MTDTQRKFDPGYMLHLANEGAIGEFQTPQDIDKIFEGVQDNLTLFFHGGLVGRDEVIDNAIDRAYPLNKILGGSTHLTYVIWETHWLQTIKNWFEDHLREFHGLYEEFVETLSTSSIPEFVDQFLSYIASKIPNFEAVVQYFLRLIGRKTRIVSTADPMIMGSAVLRDAFAEAGIEGVTLESFVDVFQPEMLSTFHTLRMINDSQSNLVAYTDGLDADDVGELINILGYELNATDREMVMANLYVTEAARRPLFDTSHQALGRSSRLDFRGFAGFVSPFKANMVLALGKVLARVLHRVAKGTMHELATLYEEIYRAFVVDEVGQLLWNEIKENARRAYENNGGGLQLIQKLVMNIKQNSDQPLKLNLVGRSAGCIHICHFVDTLVAELEKQNVRGYEIANIIFLAPACNYETMSGYLIRHAQFINEFRMFTMKWQLELDDKLIPHLIYPASLLYFVSGLLEGHDVVPIVGLQQYLEGDPFANMKAVQDVRNFFGLGKFTKTCVYSKTIPGALPGQMTGFTSHASKRGPMHEERTIKSIRQMITLVWVCTIRG